jgi:hypothetical protein
MGRGVMGLVCAMLMANTTLAGAMLVCGSALPLSRTALPQGSHVHHDARPGGHSHGGTPSPHQAPCGTSRGPHCCGPFAACGMVFGATRHVSLGAGWESAPGVLMPEPSAPASLVTSPDPPPPKS